MAAPLYKSYVFKTKDPAIAELQTAVEDHLGRRITKKDCKQIEEDGGPKRGTVVQWFWGATRRPQSATLEAAGRAMGFRRKWIRLNGEQAEMKRRWTHDGPRNSQGYQYHWQIAKTLERMSAAAGAARAETANLQRFFADHPECVPTPQELAAMPPEKLIERAREFQARLASERERRARVVRR